MKVQRIRAIIRLKGNQAGRDCILEKLDEKHRQNENKGEATGGVTVGPLRKPESGDGIASG